MTNPAMLIQSDAKKNITKFTKHNLMKKKFKTPNSMLTEGLILMKKTRGPIVTMDKIRPIAVQTRPFRRIEKVIISKLQLSIERENMVLNKY